MSTRILWNKDGSQVYKYDSGNNVKTLLTVNQHAILDGDPAKSDNVQLDTHWGMIQFATPITLSKIGLRVTGEQRNPKVTFTAAFQYATSSNTDGLGAFTPITITSDTTATWDGVYREYTVTPINDVKWLRWYSPWNVGTSIYGSTMNIWPFGTYDSGKYAFWHATNDIEINTADYPLLFVDPMPNNIDISRNVQFRIKNTDSIQHSYTVSITALRYGGDTLITNNFKLAYPAGGSKVTSFNITNLGPGAISSVIDVWADILKANNVADGSHYFSVNVVETA